MYIGLILTCAESDNVTLIICKNGIWPLTGPGKIVDWAEATLYSAVSRLKKRMQKDIVLDETVHSNRRQIVELQIYLHSKPQGKQMKDWIYNEFNQVGTDYSEEDVVSEYDHEMEQFRDYDKEAFDFVKKLEVANPKELTVIDIGCGTGAFAIHAAKYFKKIIAVDVSPEMLTIADAKAEAKGIGNIEFINSGFLQFQPTEQVDIIHTKWVLHHLPDYWKQAALLNMNKMLKPGGVLYISDVVYKFAADYETYLSTIVEDTAKKFSTEFVAETKIHIRDEYSTFDWVMQGFIERAGFDIEKSDTEDSLESEYFCRKVKLLGIESQ